MDDAIFRALADGYPQHKIWMVSLGDMWDDVERILGRRATFLTETERERMLP
ncbi:hypothetical protein GCM10009651_36610 [Microbacterium natoriense]|uniref:hypothetical protein n=1 Tax=Microbacterium natoriense TaxID=284570 RepID=UPI0031E3BCC1